MYQTVLSLIEKYNRIIIHRHKNPDGDAYGSQLGLKRLIEINYPNKEVYAVGDMNNFQFLGDMDEIPDDHYNNALAIILDVCVTSLISDHRYMNAAERLVIDHHLNQPDFECVSCIDSSHIACAEIVVEVFSQREFEIDKIAANRLLTGIVTDSGRFLYPSTSARTLDIAACLMSHGAELTWIYDQLYTVDMNYKKLQGYFINNFKVTSHGVAYMMNTKDVATQFDVSTFTVSRAMVNQMAGIKDIYIWANFTETEDGEIWVELRSHKESIVHLAREYGGGGHALACGCTLHSFTQAEELLQKLDSFNKGAYYG